MNEVPMLGGFASGTPGLAAIDIFERLESNVRFYCRQYPALFSRAAGAELWTSDGRRFLDFLSGAGALNYGHNNPVLKQALLEYLSFNGPVHSLDMHTEAKAHFLLSFERNILAPRHLDYKVQFVGPTGANAVEAAFKLARKVTQRRSIAAFTNGYHGMSLGALAATASLSKRGGAHVSLNDVVRLPYEGFLAERMGSFEVVESLLTQAGCGLDPVAAIVLETVQGEGGLNACTRDWIRSVADLARNIGALLIIDDIQAGCGRTGSFFSFDDLDVVPDIVCLSKSISGYGLPMSIILLKRDLDLWSPGEHNGTFRGNNLAFVTGAAALDCYWSDNIFSSSVGEKSSFLRNRLCEISENWPGLFSQVKGRGLLTGLECREPEFAAMLVSKCYDLGLIIETCGPRDTVMKFMPALTAEFELLDEGLGIFERAVEACKVNAS